MKACNKLQLLAIVFVIAVVSACAHDSRRAELIDLSSKARQAYANKDWTNAGRYFLQLTEAMPRDTENWYWLGNTYARLDQPADAVLAYREALLRNTQHSRAWHNLAVMHLRQSAASLLEMQKHINSNDPLYTRSQTMLQSVFELLGSQQMRNKHPADTTEIEWEDIVIKSREPGNIIAPQNLNSDEDL